jgi:hypothetical protein
MYGMPFYAKRNGRTDANMENRRGSTENMENEETRISGSSGTALNMTVVASTMQRSPTAVKEVKIQSFSRVIC